MTFLGKTLQSIVRTIQVKKEDDMTIVNRLRIETIERMLKVAVGELVCWRTDRLLQISYSISISSHSILNHDCQVGPGCHSNNWYL